MPTCPNGHPVAAGNAFCHQCGAAIVRPAAETMALPGQLARRRNSSTGVYAAAAVVVLLAAVAVGAVLLVSGSGPSNNAAQQRGGSLTDPTLSPTPGMPSAGTSVVVSDGCLDAATSRPGQLQLQCASPGAALSGLTWTSWGTQSAFGNGTYVAPTGNGGSTTSEPVAVEMYQPVKEAAGPEFSTIVVTPANGPAVTWVQSTPGSSWTDTTPSHQTAIPRGGRLCPGLIEGTVRFGIFGSDTSCGFVSAVYKAWESHGNTSPVTATSSTTHKTYSNIVCVVDSSQSWATCSGGRNNSARMFFALP